MLYRSLVLPEAFVRLFPIRRLRLASGLVLFFYILTHLANHALGLVGLDAAEAGLNVSKLLWHSLPGTLALYGAALLHFVMALATIYRRHEWRLPAIEYIRLAAGFSLPLLLIGHAVVTRLAWSLHDIPPRYASVVGSLTSGGNEGWQLALLAPGWLHGCLGLWLTFVRYAFLRRIRFALLALVLAVPVISGAGFIAMRTEVIARGLLPSASAAMEPAQQARRKDLDDWRVMLVRGYLALIVGALLAGPVRRAAFSRRRNNEGSLTSK